MAYVVKFCKDGIQVPYAGDFCDICNKQLGLLRPVAGLFEEGQYTVLGWVCVDCLLAGPQDLDIQLKGVVKMPGLSEIEEVQDDLNKIHLK